MCSVLCVFWFGFSFFSAHVFFFFPTISPTRLPFMPQLHAPVCKLVGRVGASPHSFASAGLVVWGGRAWFRSTHSALIHASVNPLPSSTTGEDELGQHNMAPACFSLGTDQPRCCTPLVDGAGFPMCWGHWWPYPQPPGLHRALQARWRLVLTPSSCLPPGAKSAGSCHLCGGLWSPSLAQSPRGWGWLPPWHHHQVPVLAPHDWDKLGCGTRGASRPARCHALTLSPNRDTATSVGSTTPAACTCPLFLPEAHIHQFPLIVALLTALTYLQPQGHWQGGENRVPAWHCPVITCGQPHRAGAFWACPALGKDTGGSQEG